MHIASFVNQIDMVSVKDLLESNGINTVLKNTWESERYTIIATTNNGGILLVSVSDYDRAIKLIKQNDYERFIVPLEDPFIGWFRKNTNKIPILRRSSLGLRLVVVLSIITLILITAIYFLLKFE